MPTDKKIPLRRGSVLIPRRTSLKLQGALGAQEPQQGVTKVTASDTQLYEADPLRVALDISLMIHASATPSDGHTVRNCALYLIFGREKGKDEIIGQDHFDKIVVPGNTLSLTKDSFPPITEEIHFFYEDYSADAAVPVYLVATVWNGAELLEERKEAISQIVTKQEVCEF